MKVTTKGQVTIPVNIRRYLGISAHSEVNFSIRNGNVILLKTKKKSTRAESSNKFGRLRGIMRGQLTTDEWMKATRGK